MHKACKAAPHVAVFTHKDPARLVLRLANERMAFALSVADRERYLSLGAEPLIGTVIRHPVV